MRFHVRCSSPSSSAMVSACAFYRVRQCEQQAPDGDVEGDFRLPEVLARLGVPDPETAVRTLRGGEEIGVGEGVDAVV